MQRPFPWPYLCPCTDFSGQATRNPYKLDSGFRTGMWNVDWTGMWTGLDSCIQTTPKLLKIVSRSVSSCFLHGCWYTHKGSAIATFSKYMHACDRPINLSEMMRRCLNRLGSDIPTLKTSFVDDVVLMWGNLPGPPRFSVLQITKSWAGPGNEGRVYYHISQLSLSV